MAEHASYAGERIERLLREFADDPLARERAEELVRTVVDLYGTGMERLLEVLHDAGSLTDDLVDAIAEDELISGLLLVAGLHPFGLDERIARALDKVRPVLGRHGGDITFVGVDADGTARLQLQGSCNGCSASSSTVSNVVESAVLVAAPEVTRVKVVEPPVVIPLGSVRLRRHDAREESASFEACDMCGHPVGSGHSHVVNVSTRAMLCTCRPCYLLFTDFSAELAYRSVPDRVLSFESFRMSQGQWDDLGIPVSVVFLFRHSEMDRTVAFYPGPGGATESELGLDTWDHVVAANPGLRSALADVEAVLLRRVGDATRCYLVPIDACYELVGLLRTSWKGFDGGREVQRCLDGFFTDIERRARPEPVT